MIRKQYTMNWMNQRHGILIEDDDVADACGIAQYIWDEVSNV